MHFIKHVFVILALVALPAGQAPALTMFNGYDANVGPADARPNADTAAADFDLAAGFPDIIDFESLAIGASAGPFNLGGGTTALVTGDVDASIFDGTFILTGITDDNPFSNLGYNTTAGGANFLRVSPLTDWNSVTLTFTFDVAAFAFGAYITDLESSINGGVVIEFDDGSFQQFALNQAVGGGVEFFGFITDPGMSVSSVSFIETPTIGGGTRDIWAIDDVRISPVPEPAGPLLFGAGMLVVGRALRRRTA